MKDVTGREIKVGDLVAYSVQRGHRPYLKVSRVLLVDDKGAQVETVSYWGGEARKVRIKYPEKIAIMSARGTEKLEKPIDGLRGRE